MTKKLLGQDEFSERGLLEAIQHAVMVDVHFERATEDLRAGQLQRGCGLACTQRTDGWSGNVNVTVNVNGSECIHTQRVGCICPAP